MAADTFRAFVAIELPDPVREALERLLSDLRRTDQRHAVRWVRAEGIHLTLKFLGNALEAQVPAIQRALQEAVAGYRPFSLRLGALGAFPSSRSRRVRVFWVGLEGDVETVRALQRDVEAQMIPLGYPPEGRAFAPHLTLGRVPQGRPSPTGFLESVASPHEGDPGFEVIGVSLMESALHPNGARYTRRLLAPLGGGPVHSP